MHTSEQLGTTVCECVVCREAVMGVEQNENKKLDYLDCVTITFLPSHSSAASSLSTVSKGDKFYTFRPRRKLAWGH